MCGIIGYTGKKDAREVALEALRSLEYRGYDSAGITAFDEDGTLRTVKSVGKIKALAEKLHAGAAFSSRTAIGHTRWATHGAPTDYNSHPHGTDRVMLVHNGIIENYAELKSELLAKGYTFRSETDTEVAAVLLDSLYRGDPLTSIREMTKRVRGSYAFGILFADRKGEIYAVRSGSPLIVGIGEEERFIASDITAILRYTKKYVTLDEGMIAVLSDAGVDIYGKRGDKVDYKIDTAHWDIHAAERGGYPHFMKKEIFEEPDAIRKTLSPRLFDGMPDFSDEGLDTARVAEAKKITLVACGTAMHAAYLGKLFFERYAGIPAAVEIASEFRYASPIIGKGDIIIAVSQSGETADTLAALRLAKEKGAYAIGIVNAVGSSIAREVDTVLYTWAGPEIAVASTKAYTVQGSLFFLLALALAEVRGSLADAEIKRLARIAYYDLPDAVSAILKREEELRREAQKLKDVKDLFFIGRGADYDGALEASLKLKEISYIHSEAYAAGELKHGTISLIEDGTRVVALSTVSAVEEKMGSNIKEVIARGAKVFSVVSHDALSFDALSDGVFRLPALDEAVAPIAMATALQLYAYHAAVTRGCSVDQPRNLAKSVTVE